MADDGQNHGTELGEAYEAEHVHAVYEEIASHFSSTRYKPWPIVEKFLTSLAPGSVGLDVGCGNGKYLSINKQVFIIASDRSTNLTKIASQHDPHSAIVADTLSLPHPPRTFDFAICIAVIHHLSTPARRIEAVASILGLLRPPPDESLGRRLNVNRDQAGRSTAGRALIYVWALEQKDSRRGWDEGGEQDVMVPWVLKTPRRDSSKPQPKTKGKTRKGEDFDTAGVAAAEAEAETEKQSERKTGQSTRKDKVYQRYYHLYRKGELESDVERAGGLLVESGYEKDNWWAIVARKT